MTVTHEFIIGLEDVIIAAEKAARVGQPFPIAATRMAIAEAKAAYLADRDNRGSNRNHWGTLGVNVSVLGRFNEELRSVCRDLADVMMVHGRDRP
jgi:hypothetical protein